MITLPSGEYSLAGTSLRTAGCERRNEISAIRSSSLMFWNSIMGIAARPLLRTLCRSMRASFASDVLPMPVCLSGVRFGV
jgi:hypothetical protein